MKHCLQKQFTQIFNDYQAAANAIYNHGSYGQTISGSNAQMTFDRETGEYAPLPTGSAVDIAGTEENQQLYDFINGNKVQGQYFTTQSQEEFSNHNIGWIFKESADYSKAWEDYQRLYVLGQPDYYEPMGVAEFYQKWNADHYYVGDIALIAGPGITIAGGKLAINAGVYVTGSRGLGEIAISNAINDTSLNSIAGANARNWIISTSASEIRAGADSLGHTMSVAGGKVTIGEFSQPGHYLAGSVSQGGTGRALAGHGAYVGDGLFTIPEGTQITFWTKHGVGIYDDIAKLAETGSVDRILLLSSQEARVAVNIEGARTYLSGTKIFDYRLFPPDDVINMMNRSITTNNPFGIKLSDIVKPNMGCITWAAYRSVVP